MPRNNIKVAIKAEPGCHPSIVHATVTGSFARIGLRGTVGPFYLGLDPADLGIVSQVANHRIHRVTGNDDVTWSAQSMVCCAITTALEEYERSL